ncbi:hypothetical protein H3V53_34170 [Paraburkholderia bengalensis]|uniref:Uncharacterized protein n=1 Tax=Paraburkholderia bengalensis TaxID=2747562 RepID=A0ABU8J219_9BURK
MQQSKNDRSSTIYLSTYKGGTPGLKRFVGVPCMVFEQAASEWRGDDETAHSQPFFSLAVAKNEKTAVLILETRVGRCFHYALMDMSDRKLGGTLDIWTKNRGFVVVRKLSTSVSVGLCPIDEENIRFLKRHRRDTYKPNPAEFIRTTQSFIERKSFEELATEKLRAEGYDESVTPFVEVQILENAAVRNDISWQQGSSEMRVSVQNASPGSVGAYDFIPAPASIGLMQKASNFAGTSKSASEMRPDTPVLVSTIDLNRYLSLARVEGSFGFGHFRFDGRIVLSMRLQSGSAQIYWLADAADASVWDAIDVMKQNGEVGFMLEEGRGGVFVPYTLSPHQEDIRILRAECMSHPGGLSDAAARLASSGMVQKNATTDIPGTRLEYVHVNLLASESVALMLQALQASSPGMAEQCSDSPEADMADAGHSIH